MATKKQKRQAALEKRERYLEGVRRDGLLALQKDREHRAAMAERAEENKRRERRKDSSTKAVKKLARSSSS